MSMKAKLTVTLKADEVVVAEAEDPVLWQKVLSTIQGGTSAAFDLKHSDVERPADPEERSKAGRADGTGRSADDAVTKLAHEIGAEYHLLRQTGDAAPLL